MFSIHVYIDILLSVRWICFILLSTLKITAEIDVYEEHFSFWVFKNIYNGQHEVHLR